MTVTRRGDEDRKQGTERQGLFTYAFAASLVVLPAPSPAQEHEVPMRDVAIHGTLRNAARSLDIVAKAGIQTPLGRVPVSAHIHVSYDCTSAFSGTVTYHPLVRLFAKIKQVDLVTAVDGSVTTDSSSECRAMAADSLFGRARVDATVLSGWVKLDADSIPFSGPTWAIGDSSYHGRVLATRGGRQFEIRVNMYEGGLPKAPAAVAEESAPIGVTGRQRKL